MLKGRGELRLLATGVAIELNCSQKQGFFCVCVAEEDLKDWVVCALVLWCCRKRVCGECRSLRGVRFGLYL